MEGFIFMYKSLAALAFSLNLVACAGTMQQAQTAASQECRTVDQSDSTGTHIATRQECKTSGGQAAAAPER